MGASLSSSILQLIHYKDERRRHASIDADQSIIGSEQELFPADTRTLSTKDSYGRFDGDAAIWAFAHLASGGEAEELHQLQGRRHA
jgi:hypothetical protein